MPTLSTGVTHMVVADDFGGISAIVQWLSYVPKVSISLMQQFSLTTLLKKLNFFIFYFFVFLHLVILLFVFSAKMVLFRS